MADQPGRERRRRVAAVTNALRDLRIELAVLNHTRTVAAGRASADEIGR